MDKKIRKGFLTDRGRWDVAVVFIWKLDWWCNCLMLWWGNSSRYNPSLSLPCSINFFVDKSLTKQQEGWNSMKALLSEVSCDTLIKFFLISGTCSNLFSTNVLSFKAGICVVPKCEMLNLLPFPTTTFSLPTYSLAKAIFPFSDVMWLLAPVSANQAGSPTVLGEAMNAADGGLILWFGEVPEYLSSYLKWQMFALCPIFPQTWQTGLSPPKEFALLHLPLLPLL